MRKLALLLCLALAAGLFVSCGAEAGNTPAAGQGSRQTVPNAGNTTPGNGETGTDSNTSNPNGAETDPDAGAIDPEKLLEDCRITGQDGGYTFSFSHPEVPDGLHLTVSLKVFEQNEDGDRLLFSYDSDGAWMSDPQAYDPSARDVRVPIDIKGSLSETYVFVSAKLVDAEGGTSYAAAVRDPEGCMSEGFESIFAWSGAQ